MKIGKEFISKRNLINGIGSVKIGEIFTLIEIYGVQGESDLIFRLKHQKSNFIFSTFDLDKWFEIKEENMNGKNIKRGHFIIGTVHKTTGAVSFATQPKIHFDHDSAVAEARRLAVSCPAKKFMVVEVKAVARTTDVVVE